MLVQSARAGLVPHLSYTGESSAAATIGSRGSSIAGDIPTTPSIAPQSFRLHPKKEDTASPLVTRALITGNLDTAVELCIQAGQWADALLLAQGEGLVMRTRMAEGSTSSRGFGPRRYPRKKSSRGKTLAVYMGSGRRRFNTLSKKLSRSALRPVSLTLT
ncbi:protein transport protein S31 [Ceratobasidium sp. UAMH 11750]|nr:protein transport protein S31 [Ceratobasidium sp. UAMH 11750]